MSNLKKHLRTDAEVYAESTDLELAAALEGLADGEPDGMGLLLTEAARRLRRHGEAGDA